MSVGFNTHTINRTRAAASRRNGSWATKKPTPRLTSAAWAGCSRMHVFTGAVISSLSILGIRGAGGFWIGKNVVGKPRGLRLGCRL